MPSNRIDTDNLTLCGHINLCGGQREIASNEGRKAWTMLFVVVVCCCCCIEVLGAKHSFRHIVGGVVVAVACLASEVRPLD